ncbi:MAG: hypothetical protein WC277_08560 [Bacilli bacterium]
MISQNVQATLSGGRSDDIAVQVLRQRHEGILDGTLRPRIDLGAFFYQSRLPGVAA